MILGKVVGTVWATRKDEALVGVSLQIVRHVDLQYQLKDAFVVAVDTVQAGVGDIVLVATGSSARQTAVTKNKPVDAVIMAVVDKLDVTEKTVNFSTCTTRMFLAKVIGTVWATRKDEHLTELHAAVYPADRCGTEKFRPADRRCRYGGSRNRGNGVLYNSSRSGHSPSG